MITARALVAEIIDALAGSAGLIQKCLDYYDAPPVFDAGGSARQGAETAPAIMVLGWSRTAGEDDERRSFQLSVLLSVFDETITASTKTVVLEEGEGGDPDVTQVVAIETYAGPGRLEEILEIAAAAILGLSPDINVNTLDYSFEPLEFYPLFVGGLDLTISFTRVLGGFEPTL